ncbi:MAG: hypothetical protein MZU84_09640 [Sphingobacterium sp.]|nr:hypothetical protein [Sphingobacterium sp.]
MLDKSLVKFKDDLNSMKGKNTQLDKQIEDINQQLAKKEAEVKKLIAENASYQTLKNKYKELEILKNKLNEEVMAQKLAYENLKLQNQSLNDQLADALTEKENYQKIILFLKLWLATTIELKQLEEKVIS